MSYWRFDLADLIDKSEENTQHARKELERISKAIKREKANAK